MTESNTPDGNVETFVAKLGSGDPTPGSGAAAATTGAVAAALVRMHALTTLRSQAHADHTKLMQAIAEQAEEESQALLDLAEKDAEVFQELLAARAEAADATDLVEGCLLEACGVPLRVMERCLEVIAMAKTVVLHGLGAAAAEGAGGAELGRAALRAAGYCVKANCKELEARPSGAALAEKFRARLDEIEHMGISAATEVDSRVNDLWAPGAGAAGS